jgi:biopolymer transport protein ExbD
MVARVIVTPIIDVALTLVVILLMTAPMLSIPDIDVDVPQARTRGIESESRVTITLGREGEIAVDAQRVTPDSFQSVLVSRLDGIEDKALVVVRADRGVTYAQVSDVLEQVRDAGAQRMAVAARQKGEGQP